VAAGARDQPGRRAAAASDPAHDVGQTQLQWPLSDPGSTTWYPFPFEFSPIEQNQEGDLPQLELTVDNTARFLSEYLHAGNGMEGNPATLFLVPTNALSLAYPNHQYQRWDLQVAGAVMNDEGVGIRLEMPTSSRPCRQWTGTCRAGAGGSTAAGSAATCSTGSLRS
jgi:hypothetical protein